MQRCIASQSSCRKLAVDSSIGVEASVSKTISEGCIEGLQVAPAATNMLQVFEQERFKELEVLAAFQEDPAGDQVPNGSRDRFGKLRVNKGGRPKKHVLAKRGVEGISDCSNRADPTKARRRLEISGFA